jgi:glycosyltransferase involved in cell wall biosynthesis
MRSDRLRFFVFTCRDPKSDFRLPLVDALRRDFETYYVWLRRRPIVYGPHADDAATEMSMARFLGFLHQFRRDDRINVYFNSTNTYFPAVCAVLRMIATAGVWCFDMHDDLRYHNTGWIRWREGLIVSALCRMAHVTVHAAPTLRELCPASRHLGNASSIRRLTLPERGGDDVLIIASFDERFDFEFVGDLARRCPDRRFHLHGWTRPRDTATMREIVAVTSRHRNVTYHGPYTMAELPEILCRYRISVAPYRAGSPITRYIDPLRFYHCLNAGLEVVSTDIPQARFMAAAVHVVSDAGACADTLEAIRSGRLAKQPAYTPITWEQRADRLVDIIQALPRTARLAARQGGFARNLGNLLRRRRSVSDP